MDAPAKPPSALSALSRRLVRSLLSDIADEDVEYVLKAKVVRPLLSAAYAYAQPYVMLLAALMLVNVLMSAITCGATLLCFTGHR